MRGDEIARFSALIAVHQSSMSDLQTRMRAYITWREHAVETQRRKQRALPRLVFDRERAAHELDLERLFFCTRCHQIAIPNERELTDKRPPECSFCSVRAESGLPDALKEGLVTPDDDGFWGVCHPPVPAWAREEAARPLAQSIRPHEEW